jgi:hypothetical protein
MTPPMEFNDPFEFLPRIAQTDLARLQKSTPHELQKIFEYQLSKVGSVLFGDGSSSFTRIKVTEENLSRFKELLSQNGEEMIATLKRRINTYIGVLSLSSEPDIALMWAHYALKHEGFVVGFKTDSLWTDEMDSFNARVVGPFQVNYSPKQPETSIFDTEFDAWFSTKQSIWEYECEYRYVANLDKADQIKRNGDRSIHLYDFSKDAVCEVILGLRTSPEMEKKLVNGTRPYPNAKIKRATIEKGASYRIRIIG